MAQYLFKLPDVGEGIADAEIVAWHVKVGDRVAEDAPLVDMMTDKATVEIESPVAGTVTALAGEIGEQIAIGSVLVELEVDAADVSPVERAPEVSGTPGVPAVAVARAEAVDAGPAERPAGEPPSPPATAPAAAAGAKAPPIPASPTVRARARDLGIDLAQVTPAREGRIRHSDLDAFLTYNGSYRAATEAPRPDEQVKVVGLRRRIAENMAAAKRHIPHFSYVEEIDVTELERIRASLNEARAERPKLTLLPFIMVAACRVLPRFPMLNARYDDEAGIVTRYGAVHMGIATQTQAGLMVPVIRNAHAMNLWQLARELGHRADAARSGRAASAELSGSTLTITSLGALGGISTTPVINRPEVAIIGPNRIVERCVFVTDDTGRERPSKRKLMNISMSCDHRVVDGWDAASFMQAVKRLLENPVLLVS